MLSLLRLRVSISAIKADCFDKHRGQNLWNLEDRYDMYEKLTIYIQLKISAAETGSISGTLY